MQKKKFQQGDDIKLRQDVEIAIKEVLQKFLGVPLHQRVLASAIHHDSLEPSGDAFQIIVRVEVHEREHIPDTPTGTQTQTNV